MISPSAEQQLVLEAGLRPTRIAAGAGTGKTTTVAMLVADLVERRGVEPEEILGVTFTTKAAGELADRIRSVLTPLAGPGREAEVHTYHGFAAQLIREFGALVGIERGAGVITPTFSRQLLFDVVQHRLFHHFDPTWVGSIERIQRLGSALGDHLADPRDVASTASDADPWPERLELLAAWEDYQSEKQRLGVVDYADLISAAVRLVEGHPDVNDRIRSRYRVVLLDEYQDTNPAQRVLLQTLFGGGFPVVAVGDTDQTIYEWRGATPDNFTSFDRHFPQSDGRPAEHRRLTVNRRSDEQILRVANQIRRQIDDDSDPLTPGPDAERGTVGVRWAADAIVEADWIADRAIQLHAEGVSWREMAVLFRKNRHIALVHDALTERDIPVEVANLGGLLSVPEVADVRAWLRILDAPEDGPALLRILFGPRHALGMGDIAHLSRWVAGMHRETRDELDEAALDHERMVRHTMLEAIDRLDDIETLPNRTRLSLERFRQDYRHLLEVAQGTTLAELTRSVLDVTGMWRDVEAMSPSGRLSARLNLYRFLDLTEEWSPLEGRPSLPAFLAHLEAMEDNPADELDAARLSGEEAMGLLTVHRAKGLEWDVVFVPAVTKGDFPTKSRGFPNPYERAQWLPHEWRRDDPPPFDASTPKKEATAILRESHLLQEWRTAYVAVTRARHRLYVSGAYWYGAPTPTQQATTPSELFELVEGVGGTENMGTDPETPRPEVLRAPDQTPAPDPLFPDGWAAATRDAIDDPQTVLQRAAARGLESATQNTIDDFSERLFDIEQIPASTVVSTPATSVTGLVSYAACPRRHYWLEVDRLPRRPSPAARRGVEVHRRIELHGLGEVPMSELDPESYDGIDAESPARPGTNPYAVYLASEYGRRRPIQVEVPFQFDTAAGLMVRGRIDAVYPDDGGWEIVDFKSGMRRDEPWLAVQLQAYALAAHRVDFGVPRPPHLRVSFVYLGGELDVASHPVDEVWLQRAEDEVESLSAGIVAGEFAPEPSEACRNCEFARFCPPGTAWLEEHGR